MPSDALLTVDLRALADNFALCRCAAGSAEVAPVVKADAYGLGAERVAARLWREGARRFFVARIAEGERLRAVLGEAAVIYVLDGCPADAAARLHAAELLPVLNSTGQVEAWAALARSLRRTLTAVLHVDTGMNRLGLRLDEAEALALSPDRLRGLEVELVISHLACADQAGHALTPLQVERFEAARRLFPGARASLANSAGLFRDPTWSFDLVRPGISLYGGGPFGAPDPRIQAVATLTAPVLQVRTVRPGESVGYGGAFTAPRAMRVAVAAAGYADGVLRASSPHGYGWLNGAPLPLLGRISMDLIALDASDCEAAEGDEVELFGPHRLLDDAAAAAGTIAYELLVRAGARTPRRYIGEAA